MKTKDRYLIFKGESNDKISSTNDLEAAKELVRTLDAELEESDLENYWILDTETGTSIGAYDDDEEGVDLVAIPEEVLKDRWDEENPVSSGSCPICGETFEDLEFQKYAWDPENSELYYAAKCPNCGEIIYVSD